MNAPFEVLILAAGGSSRLGNNRIKQLLPWGSSTLMEQTIRKAISLNPMNIHVVLGGYFNEISPKIEHFPVTILQHKNWKEGIGSTIAFGMQQVKSNVLILLIDQPFIMEKNHEHLTNLVAFWQQNPLIPAATLYCIENRNGVPAIFPKSMIPMLSSLKNDKGAGFLLNNPSHSHSVSSLKVPFSDLVDIDTLETYQKLLKTPVSKP